MITALGAMKVRTAAEFVTALAATEPRQQIKLTIKRGEESKDFDVTLGQQPLDLVRPEFQSKPVEVVTPGKHDPLSFLTTIQQFDERVLANDNKELGGVNLRGGAGKLPNQLRSSCGSVGKSRSWDWKSRRPIAWQSCRRTSSRTIRFRPTTWCWTWR